MYKLFTLECYNALTDSWCVVGVFISYEDAKMAKESLEQSNPSLFYDITDSEIIGTYAAFCSLSASS